MIILCVKAFVNYKKIKKIECRITMKKNVVLKPTEARNNEKSRIWMVLLLRHVKSKNGGASS